MPETNISKMSTDDKAKWLDEYCSNLHEENKKFHWEKDNYLIRRELQFPADFDAFINYMHKVISEPSLLQINIDDVMVSTDINLGTRMLNGGTLYMYEIKYDKKTAPNIREKELVLEGKICDSCLHIFYGDFEIENVSKSMSLLESAVDNSEILSIFTCCTTGALDDKCIMVAFCHYTDVVNFGRLSEEKTGDEESKNEEIEIPDIFDRRNSRR